MKKIFLLVLLCTAFFALPLATAGNFANGFRGIPWGAEAPKAEAAENFANGFRGIPWGAKTPQAEGSGNKWDLYYIGRSLSEKQYERGDEDLSFAGAEVIFIEYHFQESLGFVEVLISFRGIENYKLIRKACFENWGQPVAGRIDKEFLGPQQLNNEKKDLAIFNYKKIRHTWKGKGITIYLEHYNMGKKKGRMTVHLTGYNDKKKIDDAKYQQEQEETKAFLEELGLI